MAAIPFTVSYTQNDDGQPGQLTLNGETKTASGRLDNVGDFVFAEDFSPGGERATVECVRTSKKTMQIRIIFLIGPTSGQPGSLCYDDICALVDKVLDDVKITFD